MGGSEKPKGSTGKVRTDGRGRSVWADTVNTAKFELVTTQELRTILASTDDEQRESIEQAAATADDGVLARNADTGLFQIIDETSLREILDHDAQPAGRPADVTLEPLESEEDSPSLSLVSTQALRKIIRSETPENPSDELLDADIIDTGGFDPYNSS